MQELSNFIKVGDEIKVPGVKTPIKITAVGKISAYGEGPKGRKFWFLINQHSNCLYCNFSGRTEFVRRL
jgi:hypothetical protein